MRIILFLLITGGIFITSCKKTDPVAEDLMLTQTPTISDIDGNTYKTVTIGKQVWMASNLKTTKFNDGKAIPLVKDGATWINLLTPEYCWYNNDAATYKSTYGALYNWFAVETGKLCPKGWHVPKDSEWTTLSDSIFGLGARLKEVGTSHWLYPNTGASNMTGFTAVPAGQRNAAFGEFQTIGFDTTWWSSTTDGWAWIHTCSLQTNSWYLFRGSLGWGSGLSVRCIKN